MDEALPRGLWGRIAGWTASHRLAAVVISASFLGVLALGNLALQPSFNFLSAFRAPTDSGRGFEQLKEHFPAGDLAPTTVLLTLRGDKADVYQNLRKIDDTNAALSTAPGVAEVSGPTPATRQSPRGAARKATVDDLGSAGGRRKRHPPGPRARPERGRAPTASAARRSARNCHRRPRPELPVRLGRLDDGPVHRALRERPLRPKHHRPHRSVAEYFRGKL